MDSASFTSEISLLEYLKGQDFPGTKYDLSHPIAVQRIGSGGINFTYRVTFADYSTTSNGTQAQTRRRVWSAVLKYATEYVAADPSRPFSSERQVFEAHALQELSLHLHVHNSDHLSPVILPELYFFDQNMHILIMEDKCAPAHLRVNGEEPPKLISLKDMCKGSTESEEHLRLMDAVGNQLGRFLASLHQLSADHRNSESGTLYDLFRHNAIGRHLDVQATFAEVPDKLEKFGIVLGSSENEDLTRVIRNISAEILHKPEVIIMGDFE